MFWADRDLNTWTNQQHTVPQLGHHLAAFANGHIWSSLIEIMCVNIPHHSHHGTTTPQKPWEGMAPSMMSRLMRFWSCGSDDLID